MSPLVSIIIPAYNAAKFVSETIDSILVQSYKNIELIVVNDGSTDSTEEVLKSYGTRIRSVSQKNQGVSVARNNGLAMANGDYLFFFDSDDLMGEGVIEAGVSILEKEKLYDVVYGFIAHFEKKSDHIDQRPLNKRPTVNGNLLPELIRGFHLTPGQYMLRRKCIEYIGGFKIGIEYIEDWDYILRLAKDYQFIFCPIMFINRRLHQAMATRSKTKDDIYELRKKILKGIFGAEFESLEKKYITRPILADWYRSFGFDYIDSENWEEGKRYLRKSLKAWPWQPKLYFWFTNDFIKRNAGILKRGRV